MTARRMRSRSPFDEFVRTVGKRSLALALDVADLASKIGPKRWGMTYWDGYGIRVNVGWTEIVTVSVDGIRLIVDEEIAKASEANVALVRGEDRRGVYASIPGSALVEWSLRPDSQLERSIRLLRPALERSVSLAARRGLGRGVRAGHNPWVVRAVATELGRKEPKAGYSVRPYRRSANFNAGPRAMEGALTRVVSNRYERNAAYRRACIEHFEPVCVVCSFSFEREFGVEGAGFIHVHHLEPLAGGRRRKINPIKDLVPVCPNCHAMIHRRDPPIPIDELKEILGRRRRNR